MSEEKLITDPERQEKVYCDACGLLDSFTYIIRFERKVTVLKNAARKFRKLGDYKDSREKAAFSQKLAEQEEKKGSKASFEKALEKEKSAKVKSDYVDTIEEFKRTSKNEEYKEEGKKHITYCKEQIIKIENKAAAKRRLIVLGILAVLAVIFWRTPGCPYVKGMVHQQMGQYRKALVNYEQAGHLPGVTGHKNACYYALAQDALKQGKEKKALKLLKKTVDSDKAEAQEWKLECKLIKETQVGKRVIFGDGRWTIAAKEGNKVLLVYTKVSKKSIYARTQDVTWRDSEVFKWLNTKFAPVKFSEEELNVICEQYTGKKASGTLTQEKVFVLSEQEYLQYHKAVIPSDENYWLRDEPLTKMQASYVSADGDVKKTYVNDTVCHIRPAVWVSLKE